jgi:hypothetical protein
VPEVVVIVASGAGANGGIEKWGHFAPHRWEHRDQERHEVMIGGEGLTRGAAGVLETVLHEAAHGLAAARGVGDTSRQGRYHNKRYKAIAAELGLKVEAMAPYGWAQTELSQEATRRYGRQLRELERALVLWRREEPPRGGRGKSTGDGHQLWLCSCEPPRRIRLSASTAEQGPIVCGICDEEFEPEPGDEPGGQEAQE